MNLTITVIRLCCDFKNKILELMYHKKTCKYNHIFFINKTIFNHQLLSSIRNKKLEIETLKNKKLFLYIFSFVQKNKLIH